MSKFDVSPCRNCARNFDNIESEKGEGCTRLECIHRPDLLNYYLKKGTESD